MKGHVYRRAKTWTYKYDAPPDPLTGKRRMVTKGGFPTEKQAWKACREAMAKAESGRYVAAARRTVEQYLTHDWLPAVRLTLKPTTLASYEDYIRAYVVPAIGAVQLQALDPQRLTGFYQHLLAAGRVKTRGRRAQSKGSPVRRKPQRRGSVDPTAGLAVKTVRNVHVMLHKALADAAAWRLVDRNVAEHARPPRVGRRRPTIWTVEELSQFLRLQGQDRFYALYLLAATTGMRRSELCGLRWPELDFEGSSVSLSATRVVVRGYAQDSDGKSADSVRVLALDPVTISGLRVHQSAQEQERAMFGSGYQPGDYVFRWEDGRPVHPDTIRQRFNRAVDRAGLPRIRLHDMRHTYATAALRANVSPKIVSARLGHASTAFTMDTYTHALPAMDREAANAVAALIFGSEIGPDDSGPGRDGRSDS